MNEPNTQYDPKKIENEVYERWLSDGLFTANANSKKPPFCIVIPPPNVTGSLHMGHALNNTLQDVLCRYKRMSGFEVLWVPGTDHAGIATQNVVERTLAKEKIRKEDLGREKFLEKVWQWKEKYGNTIIDQLKRLGSSCDWSRTRFTMDEGLSRAVKEIFVQLYNDGLIYRGEYIVNWCPRCASAISDLEVVHHDTTGKLYHINYPLIDGTGSITVATTRPETMLGDTGVAVHPEDSRYKSLIGKKLLLPLMNREIPIIADSYVDMQFGSGGLKVTPGHDPNDFELSRKHSLPVITVLDEHGKMNENAGQYKGLDRFKCRDKVIEDLNSKGLLFQVEPHQLKIGKCQRCETIVEPRVSKQWFVKTESLAKVAIEAVEKKQTEILPENWEKTYFHWLTNIKDWCISRQLWWGHQIPVYYCQDCNNQIASVEPPKSCECGSKNTPTQDPDVLDTWFSSALWPFSTLGWPNKTDDLKKFYPTSVLITGFDILFFWVARMMMFGLYAMKEIPFHTVYLHALLRDEHGQKMSKSKGNVLDPLELIDKYGADSVRLTLTIMSVAGRDILLSEKRIQGYRNFMNKIWNATRFALMNIGDSHHLKIDNSKLTLSDRWIRSRLSKAIKGARDGFENYHFNEIGDELYHFFWDEFCAWYVEFCKVYFKDPLHAENTKANLIDVLKISVKLMHPVVPFITESLWQTLPGTSGSIMNQPYPEMNQYEIDENAENEMLLVQNIIESIRNIRAELNIPPKNELEVTVNNNNKETIFKNSSLIKFLSRVKRITSGSRPDGSVVKVFDDFELYVSVKGHIDPNSEKTRLLKELDKLKSEHQKLNMRISDSDFRSKAPEHIIKSDEERLAFLNLSINKVNENLKIIEELIGG